MVATPLARNASLVLALKFGLGTVSVEVLAHGRVFVAVVAAVVFEITSPTHRDAAAVCAFEIAGGVTLRTLLRICLVRVIPVD